MLYFLQALKYNDNNPGLDTRMEKLKTHQIIVIFQGEVYEMFTYPHIGRAIIINIHEFVDKSMTRKGAEHDCQRMAKLFTQLGFEADVWDSSVQECTLEVTWFTMQVSDSL